MRKKSGKFCRIKSQIWYKNSIDWFEKYAFKEADQNPFHHFYSKNRTCYYSISMIVRKWIYLTLPS